jgi:hypothetical protein
MCRVLQAVVAAALAAGEARASPYEILYDPNTGLYPEQCGWTRVIDYGGALRSFENGALGLDSRPSLGILDYYVMSRPGAIDPAPGETFVLEWGGTIDEVVFPQYPDLGVGVFADSKWAVGFELSDTTISSVFEPGVSAAFAPGVFHAFRLTSTDMRSYTLTIDGQDAITGSFWLSLWASRINWGDGIQGNSSLSHWNYLSFGCFTPEPSAGLLMLLTLLTCPTRHGSCRIQTRTHHV